MIEIILFALCALLFYWFYTEYGDICGPLFLCVLTFVMMEVLVLSIGQHLWPEESRKTVSRPIYSLTNKDMVSGSFVLGSGMIDSSERYYMFTKDSDGAYERFWTVSDNARLFLRDDVAPSISWQIITYAPQSGCHFCLFGVIMKKLYSILQFR